jgi:hypothetical protein
MIENQNLTTKFYSQRAIIIATYFGGPLAAGYLARQNFINLGKEDYGMYSLIIGIISTLLIFIGIFSIPEHIIDKIPNPLIPLIYTGIIYVILEKLQGKELKEHKEKNGEFYSAWKAAGTGAICTVILLGGVLGYAYLSPDEFDTAKYDNGIATFNKNEEKALELFNFIETSSTQKSIDFIDKQGIPAWESNQQILNDLDKIEGLYDELIKQDQILRNYCNLRIEQFKLIKKSLTENTNAYDSEIQKVITQIDEEVDKLNK